jgi:hypothetical protein
VRSLNDLFRHFMQIGYVAHDIDAAAAYLASTMGTVECRIHRRASMGGGLPPWMGGEPGAPWVLVDGAPAQEWVIDVLLVNAGPTNLEVISPVSGAVELYRRRLRRDAPLTVHHLGFRVDDFDEASEIVRRSGRSWAQYGESGDVRMGYLDMTAELGHFVEVMQLNGASADRFEVLERMSATRSRRPVRPGDPGH